MNTIARMTSLATLMMLFASMASAQTTPDEHAAHHPAGDTAAAPTASTPSSEKVQTPMSRMQDNMTAMQALMTKIRSTEDPAERQRLMQQHMKAMHEQMDMMRGMGMGGGQRHDGASAMPKERSGGTTGGGMMAHDMMMGHQMMQDRMDMMQMMMEQMVEHQQLQESSKSRK